MSRIYLSPPHLAGTEWDLVRETLESNWIAPLGPQVDAFEREFAALSGRGHAAALSSGTAALHLALRLVGVEAGDTVLCSSLTFIASVNAAIYLGAEPIFVDAERSTWNLDPDLVAEELAASARRGRLPKAVLAVDLYGQCADYARLAPLCAEYGVPLIEDAAEALGATAWDRPAGNFGRLAVFSFNGNKIITTSGGGMLVGDDEELISRARWLAAQARDPAPHYEHSEVGYNYRLSNLLAAVGRAQVAVLGERVAARRRNFERYRELLSGVEGITWMPEPEWSRSNRWLTCLLFDPKRFGASREDVRLALEAENIEARPVWKPMHLQPVFEGRRVVGGEVAEDLFARGLCLPSGSSLTEGDLERVAEVVRRSRRAG